MRDRWLSLVGFVCGVAFGQALGVSAVRGEFGIVFWAAVVGILAWLVNFCFFLNKEVR